MCIIYKMRNDCLCWLFLVTVDIIRDWLPQVTEVPFCAGIELGRCTAPSTVFSQPYGEKRSFGVLFMVSWVNTYSEWIWCTGTLIIYHILILTRPGMTSSLTSDGSVNDITRHFSLNLFLVLSFETKMFHLKCRWKVLRANQRYGNLPFISINKSFRKTVSLKTFPWLFPHPNFT